MTPFYTLTANNNVGSAFAIFPTNDANPISVGNATKKLLSSVQTSLPVNMKVFSVFDLATALQNAVNDVYLAILMAIILVVSVTLVFLGNWRATLILIVAIPLCLISTFAVMYSLRYSINVITLMAMVLAVGLVVDDAIVVLENTVRHLEKGLSAFDAALVSIQEISFAVFGITIALVAVYIPIAFLPNDITGIYFSNFSFTLAGAILISGFLALTLSPMMCAHLLKPKNHLTPYENRLNKATLNIQKQYRWFLKLVLQFKKWVLWLLLGTFLIGVMTFHFLSTDVLPPTTFNYVTAAISGPASVTSDYMYPLVKKMQSEVKTIKGVDNMITFINPNGTVTPWFELSDNTWSRKSNAKIANEITQIIRNIPGLTGSASVFDMNQASNDSNYQGTIPLYLTGNVSFQDLSNAAAIMIGQLNQYPGISSSFNDMIFNTPEFNLTVNQNLASQLEVSMNDILKALSTFLGGYTAVSLYQSKGYGYPIIIQLPSSSLSDLSILQQLKVKNNHGQLLPLSQFVNATSSFDLPVRYHINRQRAGEIDIGLSPGYTIGEVVNRVNAIASQVLPQGIGLEWGGAAKKLENSNGTLVIVFSLGLAFIYLVLTALFESFIDPLIILLTLPLCIVGALIALKLISGTLNIYTGIALLTLIGLVSKHGILITQFANQLRSRGLGVEEAVMESAVIRLRPILMTSFTMILGSLPLIFGGGIDAIGKFQMGVVVVVGLLIGSFFSLFVVPIAYLMLAKFKTG